MTNLNALPFLRWTGSKSWLVKKELNRFLPKDYNKYYEPFIGGGSVFFHLKPKMAKLNDLNQELVNTYTQIKLNVEGVIEELKKLKNSREDYYKIRNYSATTDIERAARLIYLNRTSFNGIYRVNSLGHYNVPYGYRSNVDLVTEHNLRKVNLSLSNVEITNVDFSECIKDVQKNDLVYLDPPYTVAHKNNGFIEYNSKLFSWEDQELLSETIQTIIQKEAFFILSNADHESIKELYKGIGEIHIVKRYSKVGGRNKTRGMFSELIITNTNSE